MAVTPLSYQQTAEAFKKKNWQNGGTTVTPTTVGGVTPAKPVIPMSAEVAARETMDKQKSAQAWINNPNSGQGGLDAYTAKQNERYAGALSANDTDLTNRLTADAQRVGYTLNAPKLPESTEKLTATQTETPAPLSAGQTQNGMYAPLSRDQISAEAATRMAKQRAAIEGAVTSGKTARTNLYDYTNKTTNDSRVLGDFSRTQTARPFSNLGRTGFQEGLIGRQREMDDTFSKSNYTNDINTLDNQLTSFDTLAPEQQQNMINEMTRLERQYGLELGSLMGNIGGQQTLAARAQDQNYGLNLAGLSGQLPGSLGGGQTMQAKSLAFDQGMQAKQYDYGVSRDAANDAYRDKAFDYNVAIDSRDFDYKKAQDSWSQTFAKEQYSDEKAARLWEQTFKTKSFQQDMKDAAASRGLQWAGLNQRDKEFVADSAYREKTYTAQQTQQEIENTLNRDKLDWDKSSANPSNIPKTATTSYKDDLDFQSDAANMVKAPLAAREELRNNSDAYIKKYGMDGYNALISVVNR